MPKPLSPHQLAKILYQSLDVVADQDDNLFTQSLGENAFDSEPAATLYSQGNKHLLVCHPTLVTSERLGALASRNDPLLLEMLSRIFSDNGIEKLLPPGEYSRDIKLMIPLCQKPRMHFILMEADLTMSRDAQSNITVSSKRHCITDSKSRFTATWKGGDEDATTRDQLGNISVKSRRIKSDLLREVQRLKADYVASTTMSLTQRQAEAKGRLELDQQHLLSLLTFVHHILSIAQEFQDQHEHSIVDQINTIAEKVAVNEHFSSEIQQEITQLKQTITKIQKALTAEKQFRTQQLEQNSHIIAAKEEVISDFIRAISPKNDDLQSLLNMLTKLEEANQQALITGCLPIDSNGISIEHTDVQAWYDTSTCGHTCVLEIYNRANIFFDFSKTTKIPLTTHHAVVFQERFAGPSLKKITTLEKAGHVVGYLAVGIGIAAALLLSGPIAALMVAGAVLAVAVGYKVSNDRQAHQKNLAVNKVNQEIPLASDQESSGPGTSSQAYMMQRDIVLSTAANSQDDLDGFEIVDDHAPPMVLATSAPSNRIELNDTSHRGLPSP